MVVQFFSNYTHCKVTNKIPTFSLEDREDPQKTNSFGPLGEVAQKFNLTEDLYAKQKRIHKLEVINNGDLSSRYTRHY